MTYKEIIEALVKALTLARLVITREGGYSEGCGCDRCNAVEVIDAALALAHREKP